MLVSNRYGVKDRQHSVVGSVSVDCRTSQAWTLLNEHVEQRYRDGLPTAHIPRSSRLMPLDSPEQATRQEGALNGGDAAGKRVRKWACALRWRPLYHTNRERGPARSETDCRIGECIRQSDSDGFYLDLWHSGNQRRQDIEDSAFFFLCRDDKARRPSFDDRGCVVKLLRETDQLS